MLAQVLGLVLASVAAAQAVALTLVMLAPPPEPRRVSVDDVVRAFGAEEAASRRFSRTTVSGPPFAVQPPSAVSRLLELSLASELHRPPSDVRVEMQGAKTPTGRVRPEAVGASGRLAIFSGRLDAGGLGGLVLTTPAAIGHVLRESELSFPAFATAVRERNGRWTVLSPRPTSMAPWRARIGASFLLTAALLFPMAWWCARRLTGPISAFAAAAEAVDTIPGPIGLQPGGPREVQVAMAAFNRMQDRLRAHVEGRASMIAAIAHDLRTPLTSLRLRAEGASPKLRARMVDDINRMEAMTAQALAFVRGEQVRGPWERTDLGALVQCCASELSEQGGQLTWTAEPGVYVLCERLNLGRALTNLLDNAVRYGDRGRVSVLKEGAYALVVIEDEGPGLSETELERVFEPYYRTESSRSSSTGGVGLGLAVAMSVARAHKGRLVLENADPSGLRASLSLPLAL